jgi:hypothetical protein
MRRTKRLNENVLCCVVLKTNLTNNNNGELHYYCSKHTDKTYKKHNDHIHTKGQLKKLQTRKITNQFPCGLYKHTNPVKETTNKR